MATQPSVTVSGSQFEAFRLPKMLREAARKKARANNLTFSELMRRALGNELGVFSPKKPFDNCETAGVEN